MPQKGENKLSPVRLFCMDKTKPSRQIQTMKNKTSREASAKAPKTVQAGIDQAILNKLNEIRHLFTQGMDMATAIQHTRESSTLGRGPWAMIVSASLAYEQMSPVERAGNDEITSVVAGYRMAMKLNKESATDRGRMAAEYIMARHAGALESLHRLFPNLPAWVETGWTN